MVVSLLPLLILLSQCPGLKSAGFLSFFENINVCSVCEDVCNMLPSVPSTQSFLNWITGTPQEERFQHRFRDESLTAVKEVRNISEHYEILKTLGSGGLSVVKLAKQRNSTIKVALKMINRKIVDEVESESFNFEKRLLMAIENPFISSMYGCYADTKWYYLAIEFIPGMDLRNYLDTKRLDKKELNLQCIGFLASQIVTILEYLHQNRILYRDMKPENLMYGTDGYLKLIDLGISKKYESSLEDVSTSDCGSIVYMAPEVIRSKPYGKGADWFGAGLVLFEMFVVHIKSQSLLMWYDKRPAQVSHVANSKGLKEALINDRQDYIDKTLKPYSDWPVANLISRLLEPNVTKRLKSAKVVKEHEIFQDVNFVKIGNKTAVPKC